MLRPTGGKESGWVYRQHTNDVRGQGKLDELNAGQASVTNLGRHGGIRETPL
jgi:hypothetical protein